MKKSQFKLYFDKIAYKYRKKKSYYYGYLEDYLKFIIPANKSVIELGCGTGQTLAALNPSFGVGVDFSSQMIEPAAKKYTQYQFINEDIESFEFNNTFDYLLVSDVLGFLTDIQGFLENIKPLCNNSTRLVFTYYNWLWQPILKLAELFKFKTQPPIQNWLNNQDLKNFMYLAGFEVIRSENRLLCPIRIPLISFVLNEFFAKMPIINKLCLINYLIVRKLPEIEKIDYSVSIIIPTRNEAGTIENAVKRIPDFGESIEIIFVEGNSTDNTLDKIQEIKQKYQGVYNIKCFVQEGKGKGDAVRKGFTEATGEILMILDGDLTVMPEELPKFYQALVTGKGEFINGSRLVYPLEKQSMRYLNMLGNKFFGMMFSWVLGQRLKDTLCGTKVLFKKDYEELARNRSFFGDFDPFGDFDLIFGAFKMNLKIIDLPIRYQDRKYGNTNISRFKHGLLLLKMLFFAFNKIK
ncbi:MAG: bifunctional class I SAM-dependent methyltransferase/glycosyltransferase family 2 protein [Candidatus Margulisiibacteriota bacterium]|jgi:ubiquinone/menaquinone biosynthesis C-methylase UbiE